jgi:hypothetical protein
MGTKSSGIPDWLGNNKVGWLENNPINPQLQPKRSMQKTSRVDTYVESGVECFIGSLFLFPLTDPTLKYQLTPLLQQSPPHNSQQCPYEIHLRSV